MHHFAPILLLLTSLAAANESDTASFCTGLAPDSGVPQVEFLFFDPRWRYSEWESSKTKLIHKCQHWQANPQSGDAIKELTEERNRFAFLSLQGRVKIVHDVIQLLGPAREQGNINMCAGSTVADFATHRTGRRTSMLSAYVRALRANPPLRMMFQRFIAAGGDRFFTENGQTRRTGRGQIMNTGAILEVALNGSQRFALCPDDQPHQVPLRVGTFHRISEVIERIRPANPLDVRRSGREERNSHEQNLFRLLKEIAPSLDPTSFLSVKHPYLDVMISNWMDRQPSCNIRVPAGRIVTGQTLQTIDEGLSKKKMVMIGYDSIILDPNGGGGHASSVLARMTIQGEKYYLIRNSWGTSCQGYRPELKDFCFAGHVWVKEQILRSALRDVAYVE
jgi:hypothetical protein